MTTCIEIASHGDTAYRLTLLMTTCKEIASQSSLAMTVILRRKSAGAVEFLAMTNKERNSQFIRLVEEKK